MPDVHACPTGRHPQPDYGCYTHHACRCSGCTAENNKACGARRRARIRVGLERPALVSAEPTRAYIGYLRDQGASDEWIAERTGMHESNVGYIRRGPTFKSSSRKVRRDTAKAIERLARQVALGVVHPPRLRESIPDRPCGSCGRRERDGHHRRCRTCMRSAA